MSFTANELCSIIKACSEAHVSQFEIGNMRISFGKSPEPKERIHVTLPPISLPVPNQAEPDHKKISETGLISEELRQKDVELSELALTDPLALEEMIVKGELNLDGTEKHDETF